MLKYLVSILFFIPIIHNAQLNKVDQKGWKQGAWVKYYPESKVAIYQGQFKDNKPFGEFRYYFASGKVKALILHQHINNKSYAKFYFENEQLMATGFYTDMKKDSLWTNFNEQGFILSNEMYRDDKLNGRKISYYLQGQDEDKAKVLSIENYIDSLLEGQYESFFMQGNTMDKGNYHLNFKEGEWINFHPNGINSSRSNFKKGLLHGWAYTYDIKGKLLGKAFFYKGLELKGEELEKHLKYCVQKGINPTD